MKRVYLFTCKKKLRIILSFLFINDTKRFDEKSERTIFNDRFQGHVYFKAVFEISKQNSGIEFPKKSRKK